MIRDILSVISLDLKVNFARKTNILSPILFFIVALFIFPFIVENVNELWLGIFWLNFLFAIISNVHTVFDDDIIDGTFNQLILSSISRVSIFIAKLISYWIVTCLPLIITILLCSFILGNKLNILYIAFVYLISTIPICSLIILISSITVGLKNRSSLVVIIFFPLILPIIIIGIIAQKFVEAENIIFFNEYSLILVGLSLIFIPINAIIANFLLRN